MQPEESLSAGSIMDSFVADFQSLRLASGDASYTQIADKVCQLRESRGLSPAAAYVGRSTVYDAFRLGRRRINPDLVADIAIVLGESADRAEGWRRYCVQARRGDPAIPMMLNDPRGDPPRESDPEQSSRTVPAEPTPAQGASPAPAPAASNVSFAHDGTHRRQLIAVALIVILTVAANMVGSETAVALSFPLYLDMIGTAVAAITLGPWWGVLVAVSTHGIFAVIQTSTDGLPFMFVNMTGALLWGYGVRVWRLDRTPLHFFGLTLAVALACTLVATPVIVFGFGGASTNVGAQAIADNLAIIGTQAVGTVFSSNIITSVLDKLIAGFIALVVAPALIRRYLPAQLRSITPVP
ncbi:helix-turn-helix transcriptional regulator [Microbacterium sp. NPDC076911]|uniref:helix-turn-helix domain-containing protein n=1 Tax=Microbacterium sp. NPDC076911 TaxID=3154958 RepID=UPI003418F7CA